MAVPVSRTAITETATRPDRLVRTIGPPLLEEGIVDLSEKNLLSKRIVIALKKRTTFLRKVSMNSKSFVSYLMNRCAAP
jgi:hypothetical protein